MTLQPIQRFNMDAAIIFSDILVIPNAMGVEVRFEEGEGPRVQTVRTAESVQKLNSNVIPFLKPVFEALRITREKLSPEKSLIGFCGSPWTVACYMVEGKGSRDYEGVRSFAAQNPQLFQKLLDRLVEASAHYLCEQVKAGADIVQVFDSWAGVLSPEEFRCYVIEPNRKLVKAFKQQHPDIPVIGFPRNAGFNYGDYASDVAVDILGVDTQTPLAELHHYVQAKTGKQAILQGNLDPVLLANDKQGAVEQTKRILESMEGKKFIFNLGHGILKTTPIENVEAIVKLLT